MRFSKQISSAPGINTLLEFSWLNYRDFVSVAGLFALRDEMKKRGETMSGDIVGMYGLGHFQIQQILQLPENVIKAKLKIYRWMLDKLVGGEGAGSVIYDKLKEHEQTAFLGFSGGPWRVVSEVKVFDLIDKEG